MTKLSSTSKILGELRKKGIAIQAIKNPTHEMQLAAVKQNGEALRYIQDQTHEVCLAAVRQNGLALQYVHEPTLEIQMMALSQCGLAILFVADQTPELCLMAIKTDANGLRFVKNQTPELCAQAVQYHGCALEYVLIQTEKMCMDAVTSNGSALEHVVHQTNALCHAAVHQTSYAIRFVKRQTLALCIAAIKQDYFVLTYVRNPTPKLHLAAVTVNGLALVYVLNQTPEMCLAGVNQNGKALQFVNLQTLEICRAAIKKDPAAIIYVNHSDRLKLDIESLHLEGENRKKWLETVQESGLALQFVPVQTPELCLAAVEQDIRALLLMTVQTPELCRTAVEKDPAALQFIRDQTLELCMTAVEKNGYTLGLLHLETPQTPELCLSALIRCGLALRFVRVQTPELCLTAVRQNGLALEHVQDQSSEVCAFAIRQNAEAFRFIKPQAQTPELCLAAVKSSPAMLQYVSEQTPEVCIAAVARDSVVMQYVVDVALKERLEKVEARWRLILEKPNPRRGQDIDVNTLVTNPQDSYHEYLSKVLRQNLEHSDLPTKPDVAVTETNDPDSICVQIIKPEHMLACRLLVKEFESDRRQRPRLERILNAIETNFIVKPLGQRPAKIVSSPDIDFSGFPNFKVAGQFISTYVRARYLAKQSFKIPNILLEGVPGIGKTEFLSHVCQQLGIPFAVINMASLDTGSHIGGSQIYWDNCRHGIVVEQLLVQGHPNPLIFIDEIDKGTHRGGNHPLSALYALLENSTAKLFEDASLPGVLVNASHVSWVASCNDKGLIPAPILSRFKTFEVSKPSKEQMHTIVPLIYQSILAIEQWSDVLTEPLSKAILDALSEQNPRAARTSLGFAVAHAVAAQRNHVLVEDLQFEATSYKIGFTA